MFGKGNEVVDNFEKEIDEQILDNKNFQKNDNFKIAKIVILISIILLLATSEFLYRFETPFDNKILKMLFSNCALFYCAYGFLNNRKRETLYLLLVEYLALKMGYYFILKFNSIFFSSGIVQSIFFILIILKWKFISSIFKDNFFVKLSFKIVLFSGIFNILTKFPIFYIFGEMIMLYIYSIIMPLVKFIEIIETLQNPFLLIGCVWEIIKILKNNNK